jgi:hypothetical protein
VLASATVAPAQENQEGIAYAGDYPASVGPWDVVLYEHPNYLGTWVRYAIQPGMRQRLVPQIAPVLEDKVSSIQVGDKVGVMIFEHRLYGAGESEGSQQFESSVPSLGTNTYPLNDKASSLIVYPRAAAVPCGAILRDIRSDATGKHAFFPLPEWEASTEARYGSLGQVDMDDDANSAYAMCGKSWENRLQLILYSEPGFGGRTLTLPGPTGWQGWVDDSRSNLGAVDFSDAASSLVVRWTGTPAGLGRPAPPALQPSITRTGINLPGSDMRRFETDGLNDECWQACAAEPGCRAYTWVKPGLQGPKAVCWLKSSVPARVADSNCVSGWIEERTPAEAAMPAPGATSARTTKAAIGLTERIEGFQVVQRDGRRVRFKIDYAINSTHGPSIGVGTWLYAGGQPFGGYEPVMFAPQGHGSIDEWVTLPPEARTYDEVEFFFFEPGQQPFLKQRFPLKETWAPKP